MGYILETGVLCCRHDITQPNPRTKQNLACCVFVLEDGLEQRGWPAVTVAQFNGPSALASAWLVSTLPGIAKATRQAGWHHCAISCGLLLCLVAEIQEPSMQAMFRNYTIYIVVATNSRTRVTRFSLLLPDASCRRISHLESTVSPLCRHTTHYP
jgi:hypothetical protein